MTYLGGFLGNFHNVSLFVTLYIKYVFTFQPDDVENVNIEKLRRKSLAWKCALTLVAILLNIGPPGEVRGLPAGGGGGAPKHVNDSLFS